MSRGARLFIFAALLGCLSSYSIAAAERFVHVKLVSGGVPHGSFDIMLVNGMGYIKTADAANILNLRAEWHPAKKSIRLVNKKNETVRLFLKSRKIYVKKRLCTLKKEPFLFKGKSWIPLELLLTKSFQGFAGLKIKWDFAEKTLSVFKFGGKPTERKAIRKTARARKPLSAEKPPAVIRAPRKKIKRRVRTIVIDPGHGGKDPGACSRSGQMEKNFTLDIAMRLYKLLRKDPGFNAVLTRKTDIFLPLRTRTLIANRAHADLFISIHINASYRSRTRGFEVYFLSDTASDDEAQTVANTENAVVEMEKKTSYKTPTNSILWSMKLNEYMNESAECCAFISKNVGSIIKIRRGSGHGIKQAGFYVLKGARMPAVLVEAGFITNKKDLRFLKKGKNRQLIARKLYKSIREYKEWSEK